MLIKILKTENIIFKTIQEIFCDFKGFYNLESPSLYMTEIV